MMREARPHGRPAGNRAHFPRLLPGATYIVAVQATSFKQIGVFSGDGKELRSEQL
jgi:hypothetical protein